MDVTIFEHSNRSIGLDEYFKYQKLEFGAFEKFDRFCSFVFDCPNKDGGVIEARNSLGEWIGGICWSGVNGLAKIFLVLINPRFRGNGFGKTFLRDAVKTLNMKGWNTIWCVPSSKAVSFYVGNGFELQTHSRFCIHSIKTSDASNFGCNGIIAEEVSPTSTNLSGFETWRFVKASSHQYWRIRARSDYICKIWDYENSRVGNVLTGDVNESDVNIVGSWFWRKGCQWFTFVGPSGANEFLSKKTPLRYCSTATICDESRIELDSFSKFDGY